MPEDAPENVATSNAIYDSLEAMYTTFNTRHLGMASTAQYLWEQAQGFATGAVGNEYIDAVLAFKGDIHDNWSDIARLNNSNEYDEGSVVGKALAAKEDVPGDAFALKGIRGFLNDFNVIVYQEGYFVESLLNRLAFFEVTGGDAVTNLGIAYDDLADAAIAIGSV